MGLAYTSSFSFLGGTDGRISEKSCGSNNEEQRGVLRHSDVDHGVLRRRNSTR
jgi:hypothetical protein